MIGITLVCIVLGIALSVPIIRAKRAFQVAHARARRGL